MATIKAYTDLEQSKKLAEILPVESADMRYASLGDTHPWVWEEARIRLLENDSVPCWSLAALYSILPNNKNESTTLSRGGWQIDSPEYLNNWWCEYEDDSCENDFSVSANNPIDACYEMILKLYERNML